MSVRLEPIEDSFESMGRQLGDMMKEMTRQSYYHFSRSIAWQPAVNVYEDQERFYVCAELAGTGVSVNSLGTSGLVITPGVAVVSPHTPDNAPVEPSEAMHEAALRLCTAPPGAVTGCIVYSMEHLGHDWPDGPWALPATF